MALHLNGLIGDSWWSWAVGQWEWAHGQVIMHNILPNGPGVNHAPWFDTEWGWDMILALVAGLHGVHPHVGSTVALAAAAMALAWGTSLWGAWQWTHRWDMGAVLISSLGILPLWFMFFDTLRPQILSAVGWIVLLQCLMAARKDPRWLWATVPLTALWTPLHGDWVLIPLLLAVDAGWQGLFHQRQGVGLRLGLAGLSVAVGTLLVPGHLAGLQYIVWLDQNPWIHLIAEWRPPTWGQFPYLVWMAFWIATAAGVVWTWRQHRPLDGRLVFWWLATAFMTALERRMMLYNAPVTVWLWWEIMPPSPAWAHWSAPSRKSRVLAAVLAVTVFAGAWTIGWSTVPSPWITPIHHAATWLRQHPTPGYTLTVAPMAAQWEVEDPLARSYIDGRVAFFMKAAPTRMPWVDALETRGAPPASLARHDVTQVLWWHGPLTTGLLHTLRAAHWHVAFHDAHWQIWRPASEPSGSRKHQARLHG